MANEITIRTASVNSGGLDDLIKQLGIAGKEAKDTNEWVKTLNDTIKETAKKTSGVRKIDAINAGDYIKSIDAIIAHTEMLSKLDKGFKFPSLTLGKGDLKKEIKDMESLLAYRDEIFQKFGETQTLNNKGKIGYDLEKMLSTEAKNAKKEFDNFISKYKGEAKKANQEINSIIEAFAKANYSAFAKDGNFDISALMGKNGAKIYTVLEKQLKDSLGELQKNKVIATYKKQLEAAMNDPNLTNAITKGMSNAQSSMFSLLARSGSFISDSNMSSNIKNATKNFVKTLMEQSDLYEKAVEKYTNARNKAIEQSKNASIDSVIKGVDSGTTSKFSPKENDLKTQIEDYKAALSELNEIENALGKEMTSIDTMYSKYNKVYIGSKSYEGEIERLKKNIDSMKSGFLFDGNKSVKGINTEGDFFANDKESANEVIYLIQDYINSFSQIKQKLGKSDFEANIAESANTTITQIQKYFQTALTEQYSVMEKNSVTADEIKQIDTEIQLKLYNVFGQKAIDLSRLGITTDEQGQGVLSGAITQKNEEIEKLKTQLAEINTKQSEVQQKLEEASAKNKEINDRVAQLEKENQTLRNQSDADLRGQIDTMSESIKQLEEEIRVKEELLNETRRLNESQRESLETAWNKNSTSGEEVAGLKDALSTQESKNLELTNSLDEQKKQVAQLREEYDKLKKSIESAKPMAQVNQNTQATAVVKNDTTVEKFSGVISDIESYVYENLIKKLNYDYIKNNHTNDKNWDYETTQGEAVEIVKNMYVELISQYNTKIKEAYSSADIPNMINISEQIGTAVHAFSEYIHNQTITYFQDIGKSLQAEFFPNDEKKSNTFLGYGTAIHQEVQDKNASKWNKDVQQKLDFLKITDIYESLNPANINDLIEVLQDIIRMANKYLNTDLLRNYYNYWKSELEQLYDEEQLLTEYGKQFAKKQRGLNSQKIVESTPIANNDDSVQKISEIVNNLESYIVNQIEEKFKLNNIGNFVSRGKLNEKKLMTHCVDNIKQIYTDITNQISSQWLELYQSTDVSGLFNSILQTNELFSSITNIIQAKVRDYIASTFESMDMGQEYNHLPMLIGQEIDKTTYRLYNSFKPIIEEFKASTYNGQADYIGAYIESMYSIIKNINMCLESELLNTLQDNWLSEKNKIQDENLNYTEYGRNYIKKQRDFQKSKIVESTATAETIPPETQKQLEQSKAITEETQKQTQAKQEEVKVEEVIVSEEAQELEQSKAVTEETQKQTQAKREESKAEETVLAEETQELEQSKAVTEEINKQTQAKQEEAKAEEIVSSEKSKTLDTTKAEVNSEQELLQLLEHQDTISEQLQNKIDKFEESKSISEKLSLYSELVELAKQFEDITSKTGKVNYDLYNKHAGRIELTQLQYRGDNAVDFRDTSAVEFAEMLKEDLTKQADFSNQLQENLNKINPSNATADNEKAIEQAKQYLDTIQKINKEQLDKTGQSLITGDISKYTQAIEYQKQLVELAQKYADAKNIKIDDNEQDQIDKKIQRYGTMLLALNDIDNVYKKIKEDGLENIVGKSLDIKDTTKNKTLTLGSSETRTALANSQTKNYNALKDSQGVAEQDQKLNQQIEKAEKALADYVEAVKKLSEFDANNADSVKQGIEGITKKNSEFQIYLERFQEVVGKEQGVGKEFYDKANKALQANISQVKAFNIPTTTTTTPSTQTTQAVTDQAETVVSETALKFEGSIQEQLIALANKLRSDFNNIKTDASEKDDPEYQSKLQAAKQSYTEAMQNISSQINESTDEQIKNAVADKAKQLGVIFDRAKMNRGMGVKVLNQWINAPDEIIYKQKDTSIFQPAQQAVTTQKQSITEAVKSYVQDFGKQINAVKITENFKPDAQSIQETYQAELEKIKQMINDDTSVTERALVTHLTTFFETAKKALSNDNAGLQKTAFMHEIQKEDDAITRILTTKVKDTTAKAQSTRSRAKATATGGGGSTPSQPGSGMSAQDAAKLTEYFSKNSTSIQDIARDVTAIKSALQTSGIKVSGGTSNNNETFKVVNELSRVIDIWSNTNKIQDAARTQKIEKFQVGSSVNKQSTNPQITGVEKHIYAQLSKTVLNIANNIIKDVDTAMHSHPEKIAAPSVNDLRMALQRAVTDGIKYNFIVSSDEIFKMDMGQISLDKALQAQYTQLIEQYAKAVDDYKSNDTTSSQTNFLKEITGAALDDFQSAFEKDIGTYREIISKKGRIPDEFHSQYDKMRELMTAVQSHAFQAIKEQGGNITSKGFGQKNLLDIFDGVVTNDLKGDVNELTSLLHDRIVFMIRENYDKIDETKSMNFDKIEETARNGIENLTSKILMGYSDKIADIYDQKLSRDNQHQQKLQNIFFDTQNQFEHLKKYFSVQSVDEYLKQNPINQELSKNDIMQSVVSSVQRLQTVIEQLSTQLQSGLSVKSIQEAAQVQPSADEKTNLESVGNYITETLNPAIEKKNELFTTEQTVVAGAVESEIASLNRLDEKILNIHSSISSTPPIAVEQNSRNNTFYVTQIQSDESINAIRQSITEQLNNNPIELTNIVPRNITTVQESIATPIAEAIRTRVLDQLKQVTNEPIIINIANNTQGNSIQTSTGISEQPLANSGKLDENLYNKFNDYISFLTSYQNRIYEIFKKQNNDSDFASNQNQKLSGMITEMRNRIESVKSEQVRLDGVIDNSIQNGIMNINNYLDAINQNFSTQNQSVAPRLIDFSNLESDNILITKSIEKISQLRDSLALLQQQLKNNGMSDSSIYQSVTSELEKLDQVKSAVINSMNVGGQNDFDSIIWLKDYIKQVSKNIADYMQLANAIDVSPVNTEQTNSQINQTADNTVLKLNNVHVAMNTVSDDIKKIKQDQTNVATQQSKLDDMLNSLEKYQNSLSNAKKDMINKGQQKKSLMSDISEQTVKITSLIQLIKQLKGSGGFGTTDITNVSTQFDEIEKSVNKLITQAAKLQTININVDKWVNDLSKYQSNISSQIARLQSAGQAAEPLIKELQTMLAEIDTLKASAQGLTDSKSIEAITLKNKIDQLKVSMEGLLIDVKNFKIEDNLSISTNKLNAKFEDLLYKIETFANYNSRLKKNSNLVQELNSLTNSVKTMERTPANLTALTNQFNQFKNSVMSKGLTGRSIGDELKYIIEKMGLRMIVGNWSYRIVGYFRTMINTVKQLDTEMTALKRVTNETEQTYTSFLKNTTKYAKQLGATMSDVVSATTSFVKLGYELEEAQTLASNAIIYKTVGDMDIDTATNDMISALKAFDMVASDSEHIVDVFDILNNKYAVTAAQVGEGLSNSASQLATANNSFEESAATYRG